MVSEGVQCLHRGALSPTAHVEARRTSAPLASTVLPRVLETQTPPRRAALKRLIRHRNLVAGAGSNLHLLPEQVKMVAGTGVDHNLRLAPVKMVAGGRNHHNLRYNGSHHSKATVAQET